MEVLIEQWNRIQGAFVWNNLGAGQSSHELNTGIILVFKVLHTAHLGSLRETSTFFSQVCAQINFSASRLDGP